MSLTDSLNNRYSTKSFDKEKKIPVADWNQIEDALQLAPSSTNLQPWHMIIATTEEGKQRLAKGTEGGFSFNTAKVLDASHVVLFCSKVDADEAYLQKLSEKEDADGRYSDEESKQMMHKGRNMFVNLHKDNAKDLNQWLEKQVYINVGGALLGAAVLGIDTVAMEGIDVQKLDADFGLTEKGLTASVMVSFGYRTSEDFNATLPKSRLEKKDIFTKI